MIGEDQPSPGIFTFHSTFLSVPHSLGTAESATPALSGPRNCGQSPAETSLGASPGAKATHSQTASLDRASIIRRLSEVPSWLDQDSVSIQSSSLSRARPYEIVRKTTRSPFGTPLIRTLSKLRMGKMCTLKTGGI